MTFLTRVDDLTSELFGENLRAFKAWRAKPVPIADARVGEDTAVRGHVESAGYVTPALVTGRECVAGVMTLWSGRDFGQRGDCLLSNQSRAVQAFFVVDAAGDRLLVSDAELIFRTTEDDVTIQAEPLAHPGTPFFAFAEPHFTRTPTLAYRVTEQLVLPGMEVQVFGRIGRTTWIDQGAYRESLTQIASMAGDSLRRVVVRAPR